MTDQLVSDLVHHVGVVEPPPLVLPPAFDVHTRFLFKVGQVEIIPVQKKHKILCLCRKKKKKKTFLGLFCIRHRLGERVHPRPVGDDGLHQRGAGDGRQLGVLVRLLVAGVLDELALLFLVLPILLLPLGRRRPAHAVYLVAIVTCRRTRRGIDFPVFLAVRRRCVEFGPTATWRESRAPIVISKLIVLSPIFLSIMVASRKEPKRKNSSIFPVALCRG